MGDEVEELTQALAQGDCIEADRLVPKLIDAFFATPADHEDEVCETLELLKSRRCFPALDELATALAKNASGSLSIFIRRQLAQAKVDRGRLNEAINILTELADEIRESTNPEDRSEVTGLLGRLHKQRFVEATKAGEDGSAELRKSMASYASVFDLDPAWHGANLIALAVRGKRAGIIDEDMAKYWAERLLNRLKGKGRAAWSPWDFSAAGDAHLVLGNEKQSAECFRKYWSSPTIDAFALGSTARQLREIWQVETNPNPLLSSLLRQIDARLLVGKTGGRVEWSAGDLRERTAGIYQDLETERAESLFGADGTLQLRRLLKLINHAESVCRIFNSRSSSGGGTGFLVDGALFGEPEAGPLLLTNHHVLHGPETPDGVLAQSDYAGSVPLAHAKAQFTYWGGSLSERTFTFKEIRRYSFRDDGDFTLASLAEEVPRELVLPICTERKPFRSANVTDPRQRSKVLVVGHPRGGELTFSLDNTQVVDHELDDVVRTRPRRIHYRTTTDHGNSGSPVFEFENLEVVGLHRSGGVNPLREDWPRRPSDDVYQANEAVWIGSVRPEAGAL